MPAPTTRAPTVSFTVCAHDSSSGDLTPVDNSHVPSALTPTPAPVLLPYPDNQDDIPPPAEPPPAPDASTGSLWAHLLQDPSRPHSPSTPFEFPWGPDNQHMPPASAVGPLVLRHADLPAFPSIMDSITRVVGSPRVFGLKNDSSSYVQVRRTSTSLVDAGANICLTGDLNLLVDVVEIPPLPISVAVQGDSPSLDDCCTKRGYLPLQLSDGSTHWQLCFYCKNAVETIISPQAIIENRNVFSSWTQTGFKHSRPGQICFDSHDSLLTMKLTLEFHDGLYYCPTDVFTVNIAPVRRPALNQTYTNPPEVVHHPRVRFSIPTPKMAHNTEVPTATRVSTPILHNTTRRPSRYCPTSKSKQVESEVWLLRLGSPGVTQLDTLPGNTTGLPSVFEYHPFCFIDFKEQAHIRKQAAQ